MSSHILFHRDPYLMMSFILLSLSNITLTNLLHARYLARYKISLLTGNCIIKVLIALLGFYLINGMTLYQIHWTSVFYVFLALVFVKYYTALEKKIQRETAKSFSAQKKVGVARAGSITHKGLGLTPSEQPKKRKSCAEVRFSPELYSMSLTGLCLSAVTEEIIYRGQLLFLIVMGQGALGFKAVLVVLLCICFSFMHIHFGWRNVISKFIFSLVTCILTIMSHSIYPAIVFHLFFNIAVWFEYRHYGELIHIDLLKLKWMNGEGVR